jgi:hypothetical protein
MNTVKAEAIRLIDDLPKGVTWDDVLYELYVKMKIEHSLQEAEKGNIFSHAEAKKRLLRK